MSSRPTIHRDAAALAEQIIQETDGRIVLGLPLGLGKANTIANALFARARDDRGISLRIITALTLQAPRPKGDLESRFMGPLVERLFGGYVPLAYAEALRAGDLPPNVEVSEFFLQAGEWLGNDHVQQNYIAANYTHAGRYARDAGMNVCAQLVAEGGSADDRRFSLSCNSDITLDILDGMRSRGGPCMLVGEVNDELPFMPGPAALPADAFDHVLSSPDTGFSLFPMPHRPVSDAEHAIGIRAAALVPDGGSIQIGIGSIGDAFGAALLMRHQEPALFRETLERLGGQRERDLERTEPFDDGLYGVSEMFVPAFLPLYRGGVLKRRAADGALLHAAFFVAPRSFYRELREMPEQERESFQMRGVSFTNELYGDEEAKRRDRIDARFINNAMLVTPLGAVTSDALDDGRLISGVGGQYNFVAQAFALEGARSVLTLTATRRSKGETTSNIVWSYANTTIPRHLRDVVVTEYGVADLRGRPDRACVLAMLGLTDGRFQGALVEKAQGARKLESDFSPPEAFSLNEPGRIAEALEPARRAGWCGSFPFGSDYTDEEQRLIPALARLREASQRPSSVGLASAASAITADPNVEERELLRRLDLEAPAGLRERALQRAVLWALREAGDGD